VELRHVLRAEVAAPVADHAAACRGSGGERARREAEARSGSHPIDDRLRRAGGEVDLEEAQYPRQRLRGSRAQILVAEPEEAVRPLGQLAPAGDPGHVLVERQADRVAERMRRRELGVERVMAMVRVGQHVVHPRDALVAKISVQDDGLEPEALEQRHVLGKRAGVELDHRQPVRRQRLEHARADVVLERAAVGIAIRAAGIARHLGEQLGQPGAARLRKTCDRDDPRPAVLASDRDVARAATRQPHSRAGRRPPAGGGNRQTQPRPPNVFPHRSQVTKGGAPAHRSTPAVVRPATLRPLSDANPA